MLIVDRRAQIAAGKRVEALDWAKRLTKHLRDKYPKQNFRLMEEVLGDHTMLHWMGEYESLAAYEAHLEKIAADQTYQAFAAEQRKNLLLTLEKSTSKAYTQILG